MTKAKNNSLHGGLLHGTFPLDKNFKSCIAKKYQSFEIGNWWGIHTVL